MTLIDFSQQIIVIIGFIVIAYIFLLFARRVNRSNRNYYALFYTLLGMECYFFAQYLRNTYFSTITGSIWGWYVISITLYISSILLSLYGIYRLFKKTV